MEQRNEHVLMKSEYTTFLTDLVQHRYYVKVQYFSELHELITVNALLAGLDSRGHDSVVVLSSGEQIPLSKLVSVGERFAPQYEAYAPYCETCDS
ncbi:hypothetical protein [Larkinella harenae]